MMFERALHRYADRIYGLALIREPQPRYAARATVKAFTSLEWHALDADEHIEERLIAALPPVKSRRLGAQLRRGYRGHRSCDAFGSFGSDVRLALALRWSRGYMRDDDRSILANVPRFHAFYAQKTHSTIWRVYHPGNVEAACRSCRWSHLDGLVPARGHLLLCTQCRDVLQRWEQSRA